MLRRTDALITASPAFTEEIVTRYRYIGPAITLLNVPRYFEDDELRSVWEERTVDPSMLITSVGVFQRGRGALPLIRALEYLPEQYRLEFVGPIAQADYEAEMRAAAAPFGDRVAFAGAVPAAEVVPRMARAHISAVLIEPLSRSYELTAPNKVFDSLMAGTPMVASDMPTIARFVRDTGAGVTCNVADPRSIAAAVLDVTARHGMYAQAARKAAGQYHWDAEKRHLLELYDRLIGAA
jgi:glycosyltransferase involved in cell wall biosynthesis